MMSAVAPSIACAQCISFLWLVLQGDGWSPLYSFLAPVPPAAFNGSHQLSAQDRGTAGRDDSPTNTLTFLVFNDVVGGRQGGRLAGGDWLLQLLLL
jgi:hypothetical protein